MMFLPANVMTLCVKYLAGATGLEPATSCVTGRRSNQLNYAPALSNALKFLPTPSNTVGCRDRRVISTFNDMEEHGRHPKSLEVHHRQRYCVSRCVSRVNYFFSL
jgi:hypothetical protein